MPAIRILALTCALATGAAAAGIHGTITPASPTWQRGAPAGRDDVDLDCRLDLTAWQAEWDSPYALHAVEASDESPVEVWTDQDGTDYDPVLYLFCAGFDPARPQEGAIVCDDDDGPGTMAMIRRQDGVRLTPGRLYWLMLAWYDSVPEGDYLIRLGDNLRPLPIAVQRESLSAIKARYH